MTQLNNAVVHVTSANRLRQEVIAEGNQAVLWVDDQGAIRTGHTLLARWLGCSKEQLLQQYLENLLPEMDCNYWPRLWQQLIPGRPMTLRSQLQRPASPPLPVELMIKRLRQDPALAVIWLRDISDELRLEAIQSLQTEILESVAAGRSLHCATTLLCKRVEHMAPDVTCSVLLLDEQQSLSCLAAPSLPTAYIQALEGQHMTVGDAPCGTDLCHGSLALCDIGRDPFWNRFGHLAQVYGFSACRSTPIRGRNGRVLGLFASHYQQQRNECHFHHQILQTCVHLCSLAIEHHLAREQIQQLVFYDALTGLPNRSLLRERAIQALHQAAQAHRPMALLFLDLDRFKTINDSLGHSAGDELLNAVAARLQGCIRLTDTVARLGGDEFVLLLEDCNADQATTMAERILSTLGQTVNVADLCLSPSTSIGISLYPSDGNDFDTLLKHADVAMYEAKSAGRNGFRFFQQAMNKAANQRLTMETALRQAIMKKQLELHYQPQIHLQSGALHGVEALLRWQHPELGAVPPSQFIPLAEECGLISNLDAWVLEEACRQLSAWDQAGVAVPGISVNVSVARFQSEDVPAHVRQLLQQYQIAPSRLTLEITESLMIHDEGSIFRTLQTLADMGITLSVDDFGTGYSSLSYLKRFPVQELKIDRSFVRDLETDASDRALISTVIRIGQTLSHRVVAEGVESAAHHEFLRAEQCAIGQGYFYSQPLPVTELEQWLGQEPAGHSP